MKNTGLKIDVYACEPRELVSKLFNYVPHMLREYKSVRIVDGLDPGEIWHIGHPLVFRYMTRIQYDVPCRGVMYSDVEGQMIYRRAGGVCQETAKFQLLGVFSGVCLMVKAGVCHGDIKPDNLVMDEVAAAKEACGDAHLKVILETGELGGYDQIRRASMLSMAAGADFIKTSTGKIPKASTLPVVLCMAEAIRDHAEATGEIIGLKAAGGIRTAKQAWHYLVVIGETLGTDWLTPDLFRLGASSLLNDVLQQLGKLDTGRYSGPDYVTVD